MPVPTTTRSLDGINLDEEDVDAKVCRPEDRGKKVPKPQSRGRRVMD